MSTDRRLFAIVPAAGASRRMGRPKLLLPLGEGTVISGLLRVLRGPAISDTVVVVAPGDKALKAEVVAGGATALCVPVSVGCSTQETTPAPDAALPPCNTGPFVFCEPVPGNAPGCSTDEGSSRWLTRLPRATRYPVGCVINYVGDRDEQGDCKLEGVCKCEEIAPPPPIDGGANAQPGSPPTTTSGPSWHCSP